MMKQVQQDGLTYLINEKEEKAEIIGCYEYQNNFLIPRSIKYESQEYIIQNISKNAFKNSLNIKSIEFSSNSELQTIEEGAFFGSSIENIFIPASLIDLKERWCFGAIKLTTVKVDPRNLRYKNYKDKIIICKTTETNENYDKIVFCQRNIKKISIPSFIKIIGSHSFENCQQLQRIDIPSNSKLQTIEEGAFLCSSIESIFIPASLIDFKERCFSCTYKLTTVKVDPRNSRYKNYEDKMIICKTTEKNENYDKIFFCQRNIKEITIPSFIKTIGSYSFNYCKQLQRIDIPSNSEIQTIEKEAFLCSSIESIFIPASLIDLKKNWCSYTLKLTTVKVDPRNSRYSYLDDKMIICKSTETNENYDKIVFCRRDVKEITIPSFIKIIGSSSFDHCQQLQRIDIPSNSELQTIEENAFSSSSISSIFIPPHVTKISECSFNNCKQLQRINIPSNSKLETIKNGAFSSSSISSIFIPHHVTKISDNAFLNCKKIHLIEIDEKLEIKLYNISSIFPRRAIIMIPVK